MSAGRQPAAHRTEAVTGGPGGRRAVLMWMVAVAAYMVAVFHRASLGVAGVAAAQRLGIGSAMLAVLSVAQLIVYAAMQIPVGLLLDRFGSRRLLVSGGVLMAIGQLMFATVTALPLAILARVLLGMGDAMAFISVLRVIAMWFPARRNPLLVQLTGMLGQIGSLASALPLVVVLHAAGWTPTFVGAGTLGLSMVGLVWFALRDAPSGTDAGTARPSGTVREAWAEPGTRLGMWSHFVTMCSGSVFSMLWGYPFLVEGEGMRPAAAALLLSATNIVAVVAGPLIGQFCGRVPYRRSTMVLAITASSALMWAVVLVWPGRAPVWLLVALVVVLGANGPGSAIGFDYARTFNPTRRLGSASGIVNVGGFVASVLLIVSIGVVLDLLTPPGSARPSLGAFRVAFTLQYLPWALGAVQVVRYRNMARRRMRRERETLPLPLAPATAAAAA